MIGPRTFRSPRIYLDGIKYNCHCRSFGSREGGGGFSEQGEGNADTDDNNNDNNNNKNHPYPNATVHRTGALANGARQYLLLPPYKDLQHVKMDPKIRIASIFVHRNLVFGARVHSEAANELEYPISTVCTPLLEYAVRDAGSEGLQPQARSTLFGLCAWVVDCLDGRQQSHVLERLEKGEVIEGEEAEGNTASIQLEAVRAIATGTPRPGHSVVGIGTFRDGQAPWELLAREFCEKQLSDECILYKRAGAALIGIDYLAEKKEDYIKSAGGSMARFMFL
mmetsp:Transcript_17387/g.22604  ORF Transcript_17387/g.22604 Transcript_17387/m.22604 type:complete len:280 (-) Transcript_17387:81-920(-)